MDERCCLSCNHLVREHTGKDGECDACRCEHVVPEEDS